MIRIKAINRCGIESEGIKKRVRMKRRK